MNEVYAKTKSYLINEIATQARDMLSAIEGKDPVAVDEIEVLGCCHEIADAMTTLETLAMVAALVPTFLESGGGDRLMKRAIRWVPERAEYRDWRVPDGASVCADDFSTVVDCAECGCELAFGESYTSRLIHNDLGFGYAVCTRCYEAEFREVGESCDL